MRTNYSVAREAQQALKVREYIRSHPNSNLKSIQNKVCGCKNDKCGKINFITTNNKNGSKKVAVSEKIDRFDNEQIV